jgi:hypothetical protein
MQGSEGKPRNVVLIGWDGAQRNHVKECLGRGALPNLQRLASEGAIVAIDVLRTTDTKAGWAQILTGYEPEISGVFSNSLYRPIPKGYTVFERLEEFFGPEEFATLAVIAKKDNLGAEPPERQPIVEGSQIPAGAEVVVEDGVKYLVVPGKPYYYARESMDVFINGLGQDGAVGSKAVEVLGQYKDKPFFLFVHFAGADQEGHQYGENSKEYEAALISADRWTGKIMRRLRQLGLYDETLVYVTADHGFDEGRKGHSDAPYVFLATNDPEVMRRGERADITPTILDRFGVPLEKMEPPLSGHPLTRPYAPAVW